MQLWRKNNPEKVRIYGRKWAINNIDKIREKRKIYKKNNKERIKQYNLENKIHISEYKSEYYQKNKAKINEANKILRLKNPDKYRKYMREYLKKRKEKDVNFKITNYLRSRLYNAMKGKVKGESTSILIGCSIDFLKGHLQSKFSCGMNFENYGKWHIDHIIPCAKFDLTKIENQKKCFHYANLQPLWAIDNIKKRDKII
jgi:hypothetical protein